MVHSLSVLLPIWYRCCRPRHTSAFTCGVFWSLSWLWSFLVGCYWITDTGPRQMCMVLIHDLFVILSGSSLVLTGWVWLMSDATDQAVCDYPAHSANHLVLCPLVSTTSRHSGFQLTLIFTIVILDSFCFSCPVLTALQRGEQAWKLTAPRPMDSQDRRNTSSLPFICKSPGGAIQPKPEEKQLTD